MRTALLGLLFSGICGEKLTHYPSLHLKTVSLRPLGHIVPLDLRLALCTVSCDLVALKMQARCSCALVVDVVPHCAHIPSRQCILRHHSRPRTTGGGTPHAFTGGSPAGASEGVAGGAAGDHVSFFLTRVINFDREHIAQFGTQLQIFSIQYHDMPSFVGAKFPINRRAGQ